MAAEELKYEEGMAKPGDLVITPRKSSDDSDLILIVGVRKGIGYLHAIREATNEDVATVSGEGFRAAMDALAAEQFHRVAVEKELRREWWLNHGHSGASLYGDDGEMQCHACPADFKRQPIDELGELVLIRRLETTGEGGMSEGLTMDEIAAGLIRSCARDLGLENRIPTEAEFNRWFGRAERRLDKPDVEDDRTRAVFGTAQLRNDDDAKNGGTNAS